MELNLALAVLNPSSSLLISSFLLFLAGKFWVLLSVCSWGCYADRNSILWYLQCISMYIIDTRYMPCLNMLVVAFGIKTACPVSIMSGILKLWPPHLIILAPLSRQQSGKAPCWSDLFCHTYLQSTWARFTDSNRAVCFHCSQSKASERGNLAFSLFSSLLGFWPLKLVCLGEFLQLCYCPGSATTINICESQMCDEVQNPFLLGMGHVCCSCSQAPIRGADICVWG